MNSKPFLVITSVVVALVLLTGACSAGFIAGRAVSSGGGGAIAQLPGFPRPADSPGNTGAAEGGTPQDLQKLFAAFWQTWDLVHEQYVEQPVDDTALMRGAIQGMLESLGDQHTSYLNPELYEKSNAQLNGDEYTGIGAWVDTTSEFLTVIAPMPGSPAEEAGLQPGDQIVAVDGKDMTGMDGELVRQRVVGPEGTKVMLTIRRTGVEAPFDVEVTRAAIVVPTVAGKMLDNQIAYVQLFVFGDSTAKDLRATLKTLLAQNPKGLILDLRNNGGGYLQTAIDVASEFIDEGVIMYEQYGNGERETFEARSGGLATKVPMVVLINEGSASASEIVAGAIQDRGRGQLVGVTSFGKGSVQSYTPLVDEQGAVRITTARWLTPKERQIHGVGLTPDVEVKFTEEDFKASRDPQLEKAVEILTQK